MKILNVTPYCISNYGALLQAWALRCTLLKMGHEVQYLNYKRFWPGKFGLRQILFSKSIPSAWSKIQINRQMDAVRAELGGWNETRPFWSSLDLVRYPPQADCYLVGSDQVFGVDRMLNFDTGCPALLAFGAEKVMRIAYAASFGRAAWRDEEISGAHWAVPFLKRFTAIGLREHSGISILHKWAGAKGFWTPDPTFLISPDEYQKHFQIKDRYRDEGKPKVFSYMLGFTGEADRRALYRDVVMMIENFLGGGVKIEDAQSFGSLSYWISSIASADYVVTNSFHGVCFSILFNRPFVALGFEGAQAWRNERTMDVLEHFCLSDRFVTPDNCRQMSALVAQPWDWHQINRLRSACAQIGVDFLRSALSGGGGLGRK